MALEKSTGLVIRSMNYGENDKIITIFTREQGKITAMAKGARNTKSIFLGATQLFSYCDFVYYTGRSFAYLNQVELKESFHKLRNDLDKLAKAAYMTEAVYQAFEDYQGDEQILRLLLNLLYFINEGSAEDDGVVLLAFQLKLLTYLGFAPDLVHCIRCGSDQHQAGISRLDGSAVCSECMSLVKEGVSLTTYDMDFLSRLQVLGLSAVRREIYDGPSWIRLAKELNQVLESQIGRKIHSFAFLQNSV